MPSKAIRDPLADHPITPQNAALILIDYQPAQFTTVRSMDPELLLKNIVSMRSPARLSKRIAPAWSVSFKPEAGRSLGSRSRASSSAPGLAGRRCRKSFRSC
jgi:hypothetical protein